MKIILIIITVFYCNSFFAVSKISNPIQVDTINLKTNNLESPTLEQEHIYNDILVKLDSINTKI